LGAAVPIGPVNVQIARRALGGGFGAGFALGLGAVTVDVFYAVLTGVGVQKLAHLRALEWFLRIGGVLLLGYLGIMSLRGERDAWRCDPLTPGAGDSSPAGAARAYGTGLLMTLFNPMTLAFWFVAVPILAAPGNGDTRAGVPFICAGVFTGTIGWVVFFAGGLSLAGRYRRNWWLALADAAGGAALLVFAALALLSSLRSLLQCPPNLG
jgi:threonine/homoserine/homoserine lactone efflux protein